MLDQLKTLSSPDLLDKTKSLIAEERRVSTEILWHLREIESRRIFSEMGFGSMYELLTRHFGYSEGSAHRRLSAARLLKEIPGIEPALKEGKLTLTTVSLAQGFFQNEKKCGNPYSTSAKEEVLKSLEGKSRLAAEKDLAIRAPQLARPEQVRVINADETELRITLSDVQLAKLKKLKLLLSHRNPKWNFAELIEHLADAELKRVDPEARKPSPGEAKANESVGDSRKRYVPTRVRRSVWQRARGRCENCGSEFMLQIDHKIPYALGGRTEERNLRLLCRNCNVHAAIRALGPRTMERFLGKG